MKTISRIPASLIVLLASGALVAGCGGSDTADDAPARAAAPRTAPAAKATQAIADGKLTLDAEDFRFSETTLTAKAGRLTITMRNTGSAPHNLVMIRTDAAADELEVDGGRASEDGSIGKVEEIGGGATASHSFDLKPGHYVYICNIPGHYAMGMRGELTVL